jgi:hypothetical protein
VLLLQRRLIVISADTLLVINGIHERLEQRRRAVEICVSVVRRRMYLSAEMR